MLDELYYFLTHGIFTRTHEFLSEGDFSLASIVYYLWPFFRLGLIGLIAIGLRGHIRRK